MVPDLSRCVRGVDELALLVDQLRGEVLGESQGPILYVRAGGMDAQTTALSEPEQSMSQQLNIALTVDPSRRCNLIFPRGQMWQILNGSKPSRTSSVAYLRRQQPKVSRTWR